MKRLAGLFLVFLAFGPLLASCQAMKLDPKIDAATKAGFDDLRRGDNAALDSLLAPELKTPDAAAKLAQLRAYVPNITPRGRRTVGWNFVELQHGDATADVTDEYDFGDRIVLWNTRLHRASSSSPWLIQGLHANSATISALAANRFTLAGKAPLQLLFLLAAVLSPALMISALVKVIRTKALRRKWLWGIAAFGGLFSFQMNWATGQIFSNFLTVQFIGSGASRGDSAFAAWVLTLTIPIGAALILTGVWANPDRAAKRAPT